MNLEHVTELQAKLIELCPDFVGIQVTHVGNYRMKINAVSHDGHTSLISICVNEDSTPGRWAATIADQLHSSYTV